MNGDYIQVMREYIELYRSLGFCIIPAVYGSKRPSVDWKPYQMRKPTCEEIQSWFFNGRPHNIAIVCGVVSNNLVVLDFDDSTIYERFFDAEKIERETIVVRTGGGKRHVYLRSPEPVPSFRIPQIKLEVRSDGNIAIAPPSVHPSGGLYEFVNPKTKSVLEVDDLLDDVVRIVEEKFGVEPFQITDRRLEEFEATKPREPYKGRAPPCILKLLQGVEEGFRNEAAARLSSFYLHVKRWTPERAWKKIAEWNMRNRPPLSERELRSVFSSILRGGYTYLCRGLAPFCEKKYCRFFKLWLAHKSVKKLLEVGEDAEI